MKKKFLTLALLATVAVGAAFAGNVKSELNLFPTAGHYNPDADCEDLQTDGNCDIQFAITPCTLLDSQPAYTSDEDSKCTVPLYRVD